jgi:PAS domain S-box-containing protein
LDFRLVRATLADTPGGNQLCQEEFVYGNLGSLTGAPLQKALENTGVGIMACDASGRLTLLSPALEKLFGQGFEPLPMDDLAHAFRVFHDDGETPMATDELPLARACAGEYVKDVVAALPDADGALLFVQCNAAPLHDNEGRPAGGVVIVQDITDQRRAALVTEQLKDRLVQTVNHEFRTPLTALLGHLEIVREHHDDVSPDLARSLAAIERAGWRLRDLVCAAANLIEHEEELHSQGRRVDGAPLAS